MKKYFLPVLCVLLLGVSSQESSAQEEVSKKLPYINVSTGLINYRGDLAYVKDVGQFHNPSFALELSASYIFLNSVEVELHGLYGISSHEQNTLQIRHNFETELYGGGVNLSFQFANGFILKKESKIAPFIYGGITPFAYFPRGDFKDANGNHYYYWSDGSLRNINEISTNAPSAVVVERDFEFERSYRSLKPFSTIALAYNAGFGARFFLNSWLSARLRLSYSFTNTDHFDGYEGGSSNDGFYLGSIGVTINPNVLKAKWSSKEDSSPEEDLNVDDFLSLDTDKDGVPDLSDKCAGTVKGHKVDEQGCSIEKEKEVKASDVDSMAMMADSLTVIRETLCKNYPILCGESDPFYPEVNERSKRKGKKAAENKKSSETNTVPLTDASMAEIVKIADTNNDGKVELPELYNAIEQFFDKGDQLSLPDLRKLIDHFFDQN